jgi:RecB family exonuclease
VSSTQAYLRCPARYRFKYVDRADPAFTKPDTGAAYGRAVHAALEAAFAQHRYCTAGACDTMALHDNVARAALEKAWTEEGLSTNGGDLFLAMERLLAALEALPAPTPDDILGVEIRIERATSGGAAFKGFIDVLLRDGDVLVIIDHKTSSNVLSEQALTSDYQMNCYAAVLRLMFGWAKRVDLVHHYPNKKIMVRVSASLDHEADALATFEAAVELIETDTEFAPRPGDQCGGCEFQQACPAWTDPVGREAQDAMKGF